VSSLANARRKPDSPRSGLHADRREDSQGRREAYLISQCDDGSVMKEGCRGLTDVAKVHKGKKESGATVPPCIGVVGPGLCGRRAGRFCLPKKGRSLKRGGVTWSTFTKLGPPILREIQREFLLSQGKTGREDRWTMSYLHRTPSLFSVSGGKFIHEKGNLPAIEGVLLPCHIPNVMKTLSQGKKPPPETKGKGSREKER